MISIFPSLKHSMTFFRMPSPVVYGSFQREVTYLLNMFYVVTKGKGKLDPVHEGV